MADSLVGRKIHISGIVQGVGFRPFVYNLAIRKNLAGWISNSTSGVDIEIVGSEPDIYDFLSSLETQAPPLSRIDELTVMDIAPGRESTFEIRGSAAVEGEFLPVSPDVAICPDCERELLDPNDRRYRYPFMNCTNCGPRFSIIKDIPYDRPNTTMDVFPLCPDCNAEYHNPANRRFHAQPVACPVCGPKIRYFDRIAEFTGEDALQAARIALKEGKILAIKGLGGYHLACDAFNSKSVKALRERKKRNDKPFALMADSLSTIHQYAEVSDQEARLLESRQRPVVLLQKKPYCRIAEECAPGQNTLGFMLPYTPLHLLLLEPAEGFPSVLVMTSGNFSEEPIAFQDEDAVERLSSIADAFLTNDRGIQTRIDDSVVREFKGEIYPIRRARGYAPEPLSVSKNLPDLLACGAELKNTFSLSREKYLFISHHIGDLENYETLRSYEDGVAYYKKIFRINPTAIAVDLHPDYLSTKYGIDQAASTKLPILAIQHHHAHLAACLLDNGIETSDPVIGLTYDGTGYGLDGKIWGGEILFGNNQSFIRKFHLEYMPLPGGDSSIRNPAKTALAYLFESGLDWNELLPPVSAIGQTELQLLHLQLTRNINTPQTSSMGRLYDAVSALIGVRQNATYEGQAAIELEAICDPDELSAYQLTIEHDIIKLKDLLSQIITDNLNKIPKTTIAAKFHNCIVNMSMDCAREIRKETGCNTVALSGGVWQNMTLLSKMTKSLEQEKFKCLVHRRLPTNDGGISAGQLMILAENLSNI